MVGLCDLWARHTLITRPSSMRPEGDLPRFLQQGRRRLNSCSWYDNKSQPCNIRDTCDAHLGFEQEPSLLNLVSIRTAFHHGRRFSPTIIHVRSTVTSNLD